MVVVDWRSSILVTKANTLDLRMMDSSRVGDGDSGHERFLFTSVATNSAVFPRRRLGRRGGRTVVRKRCEKRAARVRSTKQRKISERQASQGEASCAKRTGEEMRFG